MLTTTLAGSRLRRFRRTRSRFRRRGVAAVEVAFVAPLFVVLALGVSEAGRLYDAQNQLALAAREGGRLAAMDREGLLAPGQSTNAKIVADIKNFLISNGLPSDEVGVHIVDAYDHVTPFNLDDPANRLKLFELRVELPTSAIGGVEMSSDDFLLVAKVVFRNGRSTPLQSP